MIDFFLGQNMFELIADLIDIQRLEVKLQAARQNRHRQFLRIGGCQQKFDVRRRLFQRFQQGVEAVAREHVHFIDKINFKASTSGRVLHVIQQIAGIFDLCARCGVDFNQINETALLNFTAVIAHAAGGGSNARFAIQPFGEQSRNRGFSDATRAGKQISVMNAPEG